MASWRDEYIQALRDRDEREKASYQRLDADLITACSYYNPPSIPQLTQSDTNLLDRTAELEASKAANIPPVDTKPLPRGSPAPSSANDASPQVKKDLAEALRSNTQLQARIKAAEAELAKLRVKSRTETKQVEELSRERTFLAQKMKDRDEEARGKTKLLDVRICCWGYGIMGRFADVW